MTEDILVIGGGVAAVSCVAELRAREFEGAITMLSRESELPYDRTLLSKDYLHDAEGADFALEPRTRYDDLGVDLRLGVTATAIDTEKRRVTTDRGDELSFDRVVVCTGGRAVLPLALAAPGVLTLRELTDARLLRERLRPGRRLAIIGGGFIGGEIAAAAVSLGMQVVMLERLGTPLEQALGHQAGALMADLHRANGVEVRTLQTVQRVTASDGSFLIDVDGVPALRADEVVVGVGMRPEVEMLADVPVRVDNGILTDAYGRSSVPELFAAGDCARSWHPRYGASLRHEHWDTARRHGAVVARNVLGAQEPFDAVPFFWSTQHGVRLQWTGFTRQADRVDIEVSDPSRRFTARYYEAGEPVAAFAADEPEEIAAMRRRLEGEQPSDRGVPAPSPHVSVDPSLCIGSANCVRLARGVFKLTSEGVAEVCDSGASDRASLEMAARSCPTGAIALSPDHADASLDRER